MNIHHKCTCASRKVEVTEYECIKCSYKWISRINGNEGPKPKRCPKCKRWDWDEGRLSRIEKRLRRDLLKIEYSEIKYTTAYGDTGFSSIPTDICATFLNITPRAAVEELKTVLNPICYLGPYDHSQYAFSHTGTCSDQIETRCYPGWIPVPEKPGLYRHDKKLEEEMVRIEKNVRHQLMQHIIDSRGGNVNKNSTYYQYFERKKRLAESLSRYDPLNDQKLAAAFSSDSSECSSRATIEKR